MGFSIGSLAYNLANQMSGQKSSSFTDVSELSFSQVLSIVMLVTLIIYIILVMLLMMIGTYVFNHSVINIMPSIIKKISIFDFLGLYIVTRILFS